MYAKYQILECSSHVLNPQEPFLTYQLTSVALHGSNLHLAAIYISDLVEHIIILPKRKIPLDIMMESFTCQAPGYLYNLKKLKNQVPHFLFKTTDGDLVLASSYEVDDIILCDSLDISEAISYYGAQAFALHSPRDSLPLVTCSSPHYYHSMKLL